jgi:hypothetical protein
MEEPDAAYGRIIDNQQPVEISDPQFAAGLGKQHSLCPFCGKPPVPRPDYQTPRVSCATGSCAIFDIAILVTLWEQRAWRERSNTTMKSTARLRGSVIWSRLAGPKSVILFGRIQKAIYGVVRMARGANFNGVVGRKALMTTDTILAAIGSTECSSFNDFCSGLGADRPEAGDRSGWREVFSLLGECEREGLVEVERVEGKIETLVLTEAGAAQVCAKLDAKRGLLGLME